MDAADRPDQRDPRAGRADQSESVRDPRLRAALIPSADDEPLDAPQPAGPGRFQFAQVEVPWALGPPDGRHVVRDDEGGAISHVVVLATLGAPERARRPARSRSRLREVGGPAEPAPVATGRATIIVTGHPLGETDAARTWLAGAGEAELADGLAVLGRVLQAQRIATGDPYLAPVGRDGLIGARVGYGRGAELAEGRFSEARELPTPGRAGSGRLRRRRALVPAARLASLLAGREAALTCEELVLRARLDLDGGRPREAALQLLVALDAALAELPVDRHGPALSERIAELRGRRDAVAVAAQAALSAAPPADAQLTVADTVARLEAALRARAASVG